MSLEIWPALAAVYIFFAVCSLFTHATLAGWRLQKWVSEDYLDSWHLGVGMLILGIYVCFFAVCWPVRWVMFRLDGVRISIPRFLWYLATVNPNDACYQHLRDKD